MSGCQERTPKVWRLVHLLLSAVPRVPVGQAPGGGKGIRSRTAPCGIFQLKRQLEAQDGLRICSSYFAGSSALAGTLLSPVEGRVWDEASAWEQLTLPPSLLWPWPEPVSFFQISAEATPLLTLTLCCSGDSFHSMWPECSLQAGSSMPTSGW